MKLNDFSPKEYLKQRRPEKFSDSVPGEEPILDRSILEYHLDTLTSRGQENQFEEFARALAEKEICPNLVPQTGPTGGGDSKVDTETYPVADGLSLGWYTGIGRAAASERWGFAFSAKKQFREKLRKDILSIAGTGRGYKEIYFISNQLIKSRDRSSLEDELSSKFKLGIHVLGRTWILDKVFANHHELLAIEKLQLSVKREPRSVTGPGDAQPIRVLPQSFRRRARYREGRYLHQHLRYSRERTGNKSENTDLRLVYNRNT